MPSAASIPADSTAHPVSADVSGLIPDNNYYFRLSVTTTDNVVIKGADLTFTTLPNPPTAATGEASAISQTGAVLSATVNSQGARAEGGAYFCTLEWGTDTAYSAGSAPCFPSPSWLTKDVSVSASLNTFNPNTLYHFRVILSTPGGTAAGGDRTFMTLPGPPTANTGAASAITRTSAILGAIVNPQGAQISAGAASCRLQWYTASSPNPASAPCSPDPSGARLDTAISAEADGLGPATLYHYRVVLTTAGGSAYGAEQTFTTVSLPRPAPRNHKCRRGFRKVRVHGRTVCRRLKTPRGRQPSRKLILTGPRRLEPDRAWLAPRFDIPESG